MVDATATFLFHSLAKWLSSRERTLVTKEEYQSQKCAYIDIQESL
jgi:hypothetical protein